MVWSSSKLSTITSLDIKVSFVINFYSSIISNIFAKKYAEVNVEQLNIFEDGTEVTEELIFEVNLAKKAKAKDGVKILGNGELTKKLTVSCSKFTKSAVEKIESTGGKVEVI